MSTMKRRTFLKGAMTGSVLAVAAGSGLLKPTQVLAAAWPSDAHAAKTLDSAIKSLFGSSTTSASKAIKIKAPIQAENGAVVPISVSTNMKGIQGIGIFVEKNPSPWATSVDTSGGASGFYSARIKMGKTSPIHVVMKSKDGKLHVAKKTIKVTVGGCGG